MKSMFAIIFVFILTGCGSTEKDSNLSFSGNVIEDESSTIIYTEWYNQIIFGHVEELTILADTVRSDVFTIKIRGIQVPENNLSADVLGMPMSTHSGTIPESEIETCNIALAVFNQTKKKVLFIFDLVTQRCHILSK